MLLSKAIDGIFTRSVWKNKKFAKSCGRVTDLLKRVFGNPRRKVNKDVAPN